MDGARTSSGIGSEGMSTDPPPERLDPFASPARMRLLVEQLPVAVYVDTDDRPHRTVYTSRNIEKILGYPPERIVDEPELWTRSIHPDDLERVSARTVRRSGSAIPACCSWARTGADSPGRA
jgi:PAS domain-containing protein